MTSTVLDVTVLLLCVSASVVALGASEGNVTDRGPTVDDVADRLVTETVTVTYESSASPDGTRTIHATRAELLAILVADCGRADGDGGTSEAFSARIRTAISDGLGPRTRIDVRAVTTTEGNDSKAPDETGANRPVGQGLSGQNATPNGPMGTAGTATRTWVTNDTAGPSLPTGATGIPWFVELRGDRSGRPGPESASPTTGGHVREPVTIGMNPPQNADVNTAIVTQPTPSGAETAELIRIVVRRW